MNVPLIVAGAALALLGLTEKEKNPIDDGQDRTVPNPSLPDDPGETLPGDPGENGE
jgi:hypothetical protein